MNDQLGPEERAKLDALLDHIHEYGTTAEGVLLRAAQMCQAARAAERERWIAACNTVSDDAERRHRPGVQTVAQVRKLAIDGPNAKLTGPSAGQRTHR